MYSGPPVAPENILRVYVILNGSLEMSKGKIAAQSFHCGWRLVEGASPMALYEWKNQGCRVVVRTAKTPHVFERVMQECKGYAQQDEGLTEVERGSITAYVTYPYTMGTAPKILSHNKVQLT